MAQAQTSTSTLAYVAETVYGVTPASPAFKELPRVESTLGLNRDQLSSNTIRADRQTLFSRAGNSSVEGDVTVELTPVVYDDFIEAALQGTWTGDELQIGKIQRSFTVERGFEFPGVNTEYQAWRGCIVGTMSQEITTDNLVTTTFGITGATESDFSASSLDTSGGYTPAPVRDIYYHEDGVFRLDGVEVGSFSALSWELNNNVTGNRTLGVVGYRNITSGKVKVTGNVTGLMESTDLYNKYVNNEDATIGYTLTVDGESQQYEFHKVKLTSGGITATGDAGVEVEFGWEAIYDATEGNTMTITRVVV
jgi:hypothetical protein